MTALRVLGLMSGTSADGIDAALLELPGWPALGGGASLNLPGGAPRGRVVAHAFTPYPPELRAAVLRAMRDEGTPGDLTQLHWALGEAFAQAAAPLARDADLIASHGQTVQHHPRPDAGRGWHRPATLQLGEAALIAQATGRAVVSDFRPADLAAGGVGAPLVPFADWALFSQPGVTRLLLNLGGIANLTLLPGTDPARVQAFDTGPANCLLDEIAARAGLPCDEGGALARAGQVHEPTLRAWLAHPELSAPPPKATGREVWTLPRLPAPAPLSTEDLAATATEFTARTVAAALRWLPDAPHEVIVAGGGTRNPALRAALTRTLAPAPLLTFADLGWDAWGFTDATREAAAFAFLGYAHAQGWPSTLPHTTGAAHAARAGKWSPAPGAS
ncbi:MULTISPECIES: anhydro-N-acetylmuramic acid kinase [unclassified Deinococcus]|uniref:anhydro-N-acetylmuramic acid kinase n=1 Tax=unclassified Deinococcus TaxID=2623546 RepID=UPI0024DE8D30|nr:anhydro-N-acetylmuramic acid kinase [Deinococcus sp. 43]MDK2011967.1 anhydro-N-acetylmuramic acid kinase [Deinococcus sp. 43]